MYKRQVLLRDVGTFVAIIDVLRGLPAIYVTYMGYDEVAHHTGPDARDALAVLRSIDKQIRRVHEVVWARAPRPYDLFVPVSYTHLGLGFTKVHELCAGDTAHFGSVEVTAVHAAHTGVRTPYGLAADCLGYVFRGSHEVYFAGDTGLFPEMADLAGKMDVALLPVCCLLYTSRRV